MSTSHEPGNAGRYFDPSETSRILEDFVASIEARCFADGPGIPNVVERETVGEFDSKTTGSGQSLRSEAFLAPPVHIPNAGSGANARHSFKSELVLLRLPDQATRKILWWHAADPRTVPHNHPWDFRSAILSGGYTEERFRIDDGEIIREVVEYAAGDVNVVPADVFHNVIDVKPETVTFLDCGPARAGNEWGYLNPADGEYSDWKQHSPENFVELFKLLNAH